MVLFMLGMFGIILINGNKLQQYLKENFQLTVFFKDDAPEADILALVNEIKHQEFTKSANYISKEAAAQQFAKEIGQDFVGFLGYNPLLPSAELFLKAEFTAPAKIKSVEIEVKRNPIVQEVIYQQNILETLNKNVKLLASLLIGISLVFLIISIILINNTIRLNLYARRFIIKSMQMVGATHGFIIRPFVLRSLVHGLIGGILACLMLVGVLTSLPSWIAGIETLYDNTQFAILFGVVIIVGVLISMVSSAICTNHYLKLKIDDLY